MNIIENLSKTDLQLYTSGFTNIEPVDDTTLNVTLENVYYNDLVSQLDLKELLNAIEMNWNLTDIIKYTTERQNELYDNE